jgi:metal-responsive CopG/Arc/MetJ family transcriptional regulator
VGGIIQISCPQEWLERCDRVAQRLGLSRSGVIRIAVDFFIQSREIAISTNLEVEEAENEKS